MKPAIALTEAAIRKHEELFPGYASKVAVTDPDLIEIFDNFAFDEVLRHGNLDVKTRAMVILASTIASQALSEYRMMLGAALEVGVSPVEAKEILYQAVPYVGIAKFLAFIHATNEVLQARGREKLVAVVTQLLPYIGYPRALSALGCVNEVAADDRRPE